MWWSTRRYAILCNVKGLGLHDLELAACQASVYTGDGGLEVARLLRELTPALLERFATEPQVVSHPASPHPRILLRSSTGMWRLEIAADRTDFYWLRPELRAPVPAVADFYQVAAGVLAHYAAVSHSRVSRLAAIVKRLCGHATPALAASAHFLRPDLAGAFDGPTRSSSTATAATRSIASWSMPRNAGARTPTARSTSSRMSTRWPRTRCRAASRSTISRRSATMPRASTSASCSCISRRAERCP